MTKRARENNTMRGLVIGKFYPLHKGHSYLIDYALSRTDELDVLVCDSPKYRINAITRKKWIEQLHPKAKVSIIKDIGKDDDSEAWAKYTIKFLGYAPDIVFSSEDYGITYAKCMGAKHQMVDKERVTVPISATKVRTNIQKEWNYLDPIVRRNFAVRVCVIGAESTGTTTLSKALADKYHTAWAQEYGRYYTESLNNINHGWHTEEFTHIAKVQQEMENQLAGESNGVLICDTNAFATRLWHKRYVNKWSPGVNRIAKDDKVDLYIITGDEIPYEQDGIRDGESIRHDMQQQFRDEIKKTNIPYIEVRGSVKERIKQSDKAIKKVVARKVKI